MLTSHPLASLSPVQQACAAYVQVTGFCWCQAEGPVGERLQARVALTHSEETLLTWEPRKREAQWMGGEGQMDTLEPGCISVQWGSRAGTAGVAAIRTVATPCWTPSSPDQG